MLLEELGVYLQAQGLGVLGVTLFLGTLPVDAPNITMQDAVTALLESPGFPALYIHNEAIPSRRQPVVDILTRGAPHDYATPRRWAQQIFVAFSRIRNQALSGTSYLTCLPIQSVYKLRDDDFGRPLMTCQFRIDKAV